MIEKYDFVLKKFSEKEIRNYIKNRPGECDWYFWYTISEWQDLSENFIREFQNRVNWYWISEKQELSEKFLIEFIDYIDIKFLEENKKSMKRLKTIL